MEFRSWNRLVGQFFGLNKSSSIFKLCNKKLPCARTLLDGIQKACKEETSNSVIARKASALSRAVNSHYQTRCVRLPFQSGMCAILLKPTYNTVHLNTNLILIFISQIRRK